MKRLSRWGRKRPQTPAPFGRLAALGIAAASLAVGSSARAGYFDPAGDYHFSYQATVTFGFENAPDRFIPEGTDMKCVAPMFNLVTKPDAIEGNSYVTLDIVQDCAERFVFVLPPSRSSYRASLWMRHGGLSASVIVQYEDGSGLDDLAVQLTPTGRTTSDGWVELATNDFPVDGLMLKDSYLKLVGLAAQNGVDVDGFEIEHEGEFVDQSDCGGLGDSACAPSQVCIYNRCVHGPPAVPVLPPDVIKNDVVDMLESQLRVFYGGKFSRQTYLPLALAQMEKMRGDKTAWEFWSHWAAGIHALHDWHTDTDMDVLGFVGPRHRLNVCFFEGDADLSHDVWPKDPRYLDILVSHTGTNDTAGLHAGDRLIAVDGLHPLAWAAALGSASWGFHIATDPSISADLAEGLGGPSWAGALILRYAHDITVLRCTNGVCDGVPETIAVADLGSMGGDPDVACDNRPFYHFDPANNPDPTKHYVFGSFFRGVIAGTDPSEKIYGMVWDTLFGSNDPSGPVNSAISQAISDWKAGARGVILDHRAGNGGTIDAAENVTKLVRPPTAIAAMRIPAFTGNYDGPADTTEGMALFNASSTASQYVVGDPDYAQDLPVALIIHRDGSASDYMPYGMKGAPKVRIFGPHPTAGAFSTYIEMSSWGPLYWQFGSGDTIAADGHPLIGHGVQPDEVVLPKQSDLIAGKDTLFEAALAWVRQELAP